VAASNYSVNIKLDTKAARNELQTLEKRINNLRRNLNQPLKIDTRISKIQEKIAKSKDAQKASMIETRRLGDQVQKLADKGLKVDKARAAIKKAATLDSKNQLKAAASQRKIAQDELKIQTDITEQVAKRSQLIASGKFAGGRNFGQIGGSIGPALPPSAGGGRRGFDFQSALISGGFPLLFGQGPFVGAAGALGGGIGGMFGQMGGFAGGIAATTVATTIQAFTVETGKLGAALNDATKDAEAVSAALGITGTEFEKNLKTLEKLGGEEEAFEAARAKMISLIGQDGVNALQNFGKGATELSNEFTKAMTQMRAAFASFLQGSGAGSFLLNRITAANLQRQAATSTDPNVVKARELVEALKGGFFTRSEEQKALIQANPGITLDQAKKNVEEAQKLANKKEEQAAIDKLLGNIQKQRVKNISDEIALLEKSMGLSTDEFEIEKQIMQMKQDGEIKDENEIRNKLKYLQNLQKERQLAEETAAAFERMSQTIATDISDGIKGMIRGTSTLNDVLSSVLNKLIDAAFNMAFFGNMQGSLGGGGFFGLLGGLFGGGGGGGGNNFIRDAVSATPILTPKQQVSRFTFGKAGFMPSNSSDLPSVDLSKPDNYNQIRFGFGKAMGGPVTGGTSYIVGERGPELFSPGVSGMITPNHALGGSTNIVVNVDASGSSVEGDEEQGRELGRLISVAIQSELVQQKRPGGLLA
jgi:hypothetical protein